MTPGEIVIFRKRKEPCCGIFLSAGEGVMTVLSEEGKTMPITGEKIAFLTGIKSAHSTNDERKMDMRRLRKELEEAKDSFDLQALWENLAHSEKIVSFGDILSVYSRETETPPDEALRLFWAIDKNTVYFKREKGGYMPLAAGHVEKTLARRKKQVENERQEAFSIKWIKSVLNGSEHEPDGFDREACVKTVMAYVQNTEDSPAFKNACRFLPKAGIKDPEAAVEFLIRTGDLPEGSDPEMIRYGIGEGFSPEALEESSRLVSGFAPPDFLEDLTGLETFSIDSKTTEDIDDAISLELTQTEARVGIHIANVAVCIKPGGALDRGALSSAETMYLPERRVDIFPADLVKARLSLLEGAPRAALSLLITFDLESFQIKNFRFAPSRISVRKNMSYETADVLFQSSAEWKKLWQICAHLKQKKD